MSWNKTLKAYAERKKEQESPALHEWLVKFLKKAIEAVSSEQDRIEILDWLNLVRAFLSDSNLSKMEKFKRIYAISDSKKTIKILLNSLSETVKNYKNSDMSLSVKIALPVTLAALAVFGGQGAGIAAFGGAIGIPIVLIIFLGTAGITSILEGFIESKHANNYIGSLKSTLTKKSFYSNIPDDLKIILEDDGVEPQFFEFPKVEIIIENYLLNLGDMEFNQHIMSFFQRKGMPSWVTKNPNKFQINGFAEDNGELTAVWCNRFNASGVVSKEMVDQFYHGTPFINKVFVITTDKFSPESKELAKSVNNLFLIDMDELVQWHL